MLSLFGKIQAEALEIDGPMIRLRPQRKLARGRQICTVQVAKKRWKLAVTPTRTVTDGTVWVQPEASPELLDEVRAAVDSVRVEQDRAASERRASSRYAAVLQVRSPDLPFYRATTVDVSEHGLRLCTRGEISTGAQVRLQIEDGNPAHSGVVVTGVTVWTRPNGTNTFEVGVSLIAS